MKKIILITFLVCISCNKKNRLLKDEKKITTFLINQNSGTSNLVLDTISSFNWDKLLVGYPYTDLNKISKYDLTEIPNNIKHTDSFILLIFLNDRKGVRYMEFDRNVLSYKIFNGKSIFLKSESVFQIIKK